MELSVKKRIDSFPKSIKSKFLAVRELILDEARNDSSIGELKETLKWGEPSYLTEKTKSGTTVRIDWKEKNPNELGLFVNCKSSLLDQYRSLFPNSFRYEGERAVWINLEKDIPQFELRACIKLALRYHLDKKRG